MERKSMNIVILLVVVALALGVVLAFFGFNFFNAQSSATGEQAPAGEEFAATGAEDPILLELQNTGTVADLRIRTLVEGQGNAIEAGQKARVHYVGVLPDGTLFDTSRAEGRTPFDFVIGAGQVIQGWEKGVVGMKVGERRLLVIPPSLGYGEAGAGELIPANATLIFEVELIGIIDSGQ